MSLFTIADLHLSAATDHPMDVFGSRWKNYTQKIEKNWRAIVTDADTVILPGDISWAMNLNEAREDFAFLDSLPGKKLLGKGNHKPALSATDFKRNGQIRAVSSKNLLKIQQITITFRRFFHIQNPVRAFCKQQIPARFHSCFKISLFSHSHRHNFISAMV